MSATGVIRPIVREYCPAFSSFKTTSFVYTDNTIQFPIMKRLIRIFILLSVLSWIAAGQGGKGGGQGAGTSGSAGSQSGGGGAGAAGGSGGLPGLSWAQASWPKELRFPSDLPNTRLVCFRLVYTYSASQPFVLERIVPPDPPEPPTQVGGKPCSRLDEKNPLMMRDRLVIGIDTSKTTFPERVRLLNINLTNQQGNPINPTPVRPSFAGGAPSTVTPLAPPTGPFFLAWPDRLPGDVVPSVSINAVYTPVAPGAPWLPNTFYPAGSVVVKELKDDGSSDPNGHYYTALKPGISGTQAPQWPPNGPPTIEDRDPIVPQLSWKDQGPNPPPAGAAPLPAACGATAKPWQPNTIYSAGTCVTSSESHYWVAATPGVSWTREEPFHLAAAGSVVEDTILMWMDSGTTAPSSPARQWLKGMPHIVGDVITADPPNGHYYTAIRGGTSGQGPLTFLMVKADAIQDDKLPPLQVSEGDVTWRFLSATAPKRVDSTPYRAGAVVLASNFHFYVSQKDCPDSALASRPACVSGSGESNFKGTHGEQVQDGGVVWIERGTGPESVAWEHSQTYGPGAVVYSKERKQFYVEVLSLPGKSGPGPKEPDFPVAGTWDQVQWQDSGFVAPASVASGQPADQTLNLLSLTLPQSHAISYFNLAAGVVYNSVRVPGFSVTGTAPNLVGVQNPTSHTVDPVLFLTGYWLGHWFPMDAEREWRPKDLIPGLSFGLSLANPTSNFYAGGSSEFFLRNVQLVYGVSLTKVSDLASQNPLNATTAATKSRFTARWFVGLTFNISGFVQGLVSAGKPTGP